MRVEILTVTAAIDFLAVVRLAPDHIRFVARSGMPAARTFAAASEALTIEERDSMRAEFGIGSTVEQAPTMREAYPIGEDMTIDDVGRYLGCLVTVDGR
ncbi:MAG: hypothetical protein U0S36_12405 [Candidatus Nanopelagicales bacterium]